jgi:penicillin-insensitive murein endopeptidase
MRPRKASRAPRAVFIAALAVACCCGAAGVSPQQTATEEAAARAAVLEHLPRNAAKRVFGLASSPAAGPPEAIGTYMRGCLAGAVALPQEGPNWEVMRPSRDRFWGHPRLVSFVEQLAAEVATFWPGLLVGDMSQPRGGPMLTGHASHQIGLDADIWLTPMPAERPSHAERETMGAERVVAADGEDVNAALWTPQHEALLRAAARNPEVARIFVNPAIKRALCRDAGSDRGWLRKIRPWWHHASHFHVRLSCPAGDALCRGQPQPPAVPGCGRQLAWWFTAAARHPPPAKPAPPLRVADLPHPCARILAAPPDAVRRP